MKLYFQHSNFAMELIGDGFDDRNDPNVEKAIREDVRKRAPHFKIYYIIANLFDDGDTNYDVGDYSCFYFLTDREFKPGEKWASTWNKEVPE